MKHNIVEFNVEQTPDRDPSRYTTKEQWFEVFKGAYQELVFCYAAPTKSRIELWEQFESYYCPHAWDNRYSSSMPTDYVYTDKKMKDAALYVAHGGKLTINHNEVGFGWLRRPNPNNKIDWGHGFEGLTRKWSDNFTSLWVYALVLVLAWVVLGL